MSGPADRIPRWPDCTRRWPTTWPTRSAGQTLRPLQAEAVGPLLAGDDALLLAPTAGGKTEAASFPLLSRMAAENWGAPSVLYLAPLKALLNNLLPRLETYAGWLGRRAALWHGDVTTGVRDAAAARSARHAADHSGIAGIDAGQRQG